VQVHPGHGPLLWPLRLFRPDAATATSCRPLPTDHSAHMSSLCTLSQLTCLGPLGLYLPVTALPPALKLRRFALAPGQRLTPIMPSSRSSQALNPQTTAPRTCINTSYTLVRQPPAPNSQVQGSLTLWFAIAMVQWLYFLTNDFLEGISQHCS
jgi:hypothetical protein